MKRTGFTLLELIMVLVIGPVLALPATQIFQGMDTFGWIGVQRKLLSNIRYAQRLAVEERAFCVMEFATTQPERGYRVYNESLGGMNVDDPFTGDPGYLSRPWASGLVVAFTDSLGRSKPIDLTTTLPLDRLRFDSAGRPVSFGGTVRLTVEQLVRLRWGNHVYEIRISPDTGHLSETSTW